MEIINSGALETSQINALPFQLDIQQQIGKMAKLLFTCYLLARNYVLYIVLAIREL